MRMLMTTRGKDLPRFGTYALLLLLTTLMPTSIFGQTSVTGNWPGSWFWTACAPSYGCSVGNVYTNLDLVLVQTGSNVTGSAFSGATSIVTGTVNGNSFNFNIDYGRADVNGSCEATISGNQITGLCTDHYTSGPGYWKMTAMRQGQGIEASITVDQSGIAPSYVDKMQKGVPATPSCTNVTVHVTDTNNNPMSGAVTNFTTKPYDLTFSGHYHTPPADGSEPSPGKFVDSCAGSAANNSCTTEADGSCSVLYRVSETAGEWEIDADVSAQGNSTKAGKTVDVIVPSLVLFTPTQNTILVGNTTTHPYSNYGVPDMVSALTAIGESYSIENQIITGLQGVKLSFNDMSLPFGGMFDVGADWAPSIEEARAGSGAHWYHRNGRAVDVNHGAVLQGDTVPVDEHLLDQLFNDLGFIRIPEGLKSIHYQLPL
jgi:hypothetical protein